MLNNPYPFPFKKGNMVYILLFSLFLFIFHPSPLHPSNLFKYHQVSMGTVIEITLIGDDEELIRKAAFQAFQEIKRIEHLMSPWRESSEVNRINQSAGKNWVKVSPEILKVIRKAQEISELSDGRFDITVGPLTELWRAAREREIPPSVEELEQRLSLVNFRNVMIDPEKGILLKKEKMSIDLGGIAKGYAVDRAFKLLKNLGYKNLIVNAGGDLRVGGSKIDQPWSIGIQDPRASQKIMAKVSTSDSAIATSGDYEKFFIHQGKRYHHIFNPSNGLSAEECRSVTIFSQDGMTADALATAVFVLGPEKGYGLCQRLKGVDCLIVDKEGKITLSPGLKSRISFNP
jgi:thiamine biosynthesis lipoprotein